MSETSTEAHNFLKNVTSPSVLHTEKQGSYVIIKNVLIVFQTGYRHIQIQSS